MPDTPTPKKPNTWWPPVDLPEEAHNACKNGAIAAYIVAGMTALVIVLGMALGTPIASIDAWAFIDVALMLGCGIALQRWHSRVAGILALADFLYGKMYFIINGQHINVGGWIIAAVITLYLFHGVRGAFAWHAIQKKRAGLSS